MSSTMNVTEASQSPNASMESPLLTITDQALYGIIVALFALGVYMFFVITFFVVMNGFKDNTRSFVSTYGVQRAPSLHHHLNPMRRIYRTLLFTLCMLVSAVFVLQCILQQILTFQTTACCFDLALKYAFGVQIVIGYVFMWVRQRLFYYGSSPLRNLHGRKTPLVALSSLSLVFVVINIIVQLTLIWYWTPETVLMEALTWLILCLLVQGSLIGLFLYPLWKLNTERKRFLKSTNGKGRVFASSNVSNLIRRCLILTSIYFVTDLSITIAMITNELLYRKPFPKLVMFTLQNLNAIANILCMVGSFKNWKSIFIPCYKKQEFGSIRNRHKSIVTFIVSSDKPSEDVNSWR